ncbi:MAG: enoyl-CoA hydratase-related protein [Pseudomonadales bacterium]|nr:enoyl-CoA hydratase-related protein [Pseudomonadales bacterium]
MSAENAIGTITLSRPKRANALSHDHLAELEQAALSFRDVPNVRVVIITGVVDTFHRAPTYRILLPHWICHWCNADGGREWGNVRSKPF